MTFGEPANYQHGEDPAWIRKDLEIKPEPPAHAGIETTSLEAAESLNDSAWIETGEAEAG